MFENDHRHRQLMLDFSVSAATSPTHPGVDRRDVRCDHPAAHIGLDAAYCPDCQNNFGWRTKVYKSLFQATSSAPARTESYASHISSQASHISSQASYISSQASHISCLAAQISCLETTPEHSLFGRWSGISSSIGNARTSSGPTCN